jgi:hypothetical protein
MNPLISGLFFYVFFAYSYSEAWNILLDSHVKSCFFENLNVSDRIGVNFELDPETGRQKQVDMELFGPDGQLMLESRGEAFGTYSTKAVKDGKHFICFISKNSVKLSFNILGGHPADANPASGQTERDPVLIAMEQLKIGLRTVQEEQSYILLREKIHSKTAESTASKLLWWSIMQYLLLGGACFWQIYYLKRFFEVRRSI